MGSRFVYVIYIRTTPEKLWDALTNPEFTRQTWGGTHQESDWTEGAAWTLMFADGRAADSGEILEIDRPRKLVLSWRNEFRPELRAEGHARCTYEIETIDGGVKFTVTHESDKDDSELIKAVSNGWPAILSSVKSLLETGDSLAHMRQKRA
ncbi:MAG: SRPBCC family protein [Hyphomonadaceae bacterium]|nr:SRPBCC family protein [Hyphomonadaceae bacterium]